MTAADPLAAHRLDEAPWYRPVADEVPLFEAAWQARMPMMLKGPTGCGKTRFVEYMAWKLAMPLVTVSCNEEMTDSDLVGRYLLDSPWVRKASDEGGGWRPRDDSWEKTRRHHACVQCRKDAAANLFGAAP